MHDILDARADTASYRLIVIGVCTYISVVVGRGFGTGPHLCLGMHLARMELLAFFTELLPRLEDISLAGDVAFVKGLTVSGIKSMPIRYILR